MKPKTVKMGASSAEQKIGIRERKLHLERNLTLQYVDIIIGVTTGTAKAMEEGKCFLAPGHILTLSKVLKVNISMLFPEPGEIEDKSESLGPAPNIVKEAQRLLKAYYSIEDPTLRRNVFKLLKHISRNETFGQL
jgi:hypothetical protein